MAESIDLSNCDREKIHLVGSIQPHGFFIAFRLSDKTIYHASANIADLLGGGPEEIFGKSLNDVFGVTQAQQLVESAKGVDSTSGQYLRVHEINKRQGTFEIYLYELEGLIGVEFEKREGVFDTEVDELNKSYRRSQLFIDDLHTSHSLEHAAKLSCRAIRSMIGFERVMMYRYLPNWDGEVIAEDKSVEAHSFMQHRFPASDIPLPARQLYLKNRSRLIADSSAQSVPISPAMHYLTRKPIDLSHSKCGRFLQFTWNICVT